MFEQIRNFLFGESIDDDLSNHGSEWIQLGDWSLSHQVVVALLVITVLGLTLWNLRRTSGFWGRATVFSLRLGVIGILLFAFYQPAQLEEVTAQSTNSILLLLDNSSSMTLGHEKGIRRDAVVDFVHRQREAIRALEETNVVESYRFGEQLQPVDWRKIEQDLDATDAHTYFLKSFEDLSERYRNRDIGGILLVSDGIDNGRTSQSLADGDELDRETLRVLKAFDAPIHTFGLDKGTIHDVSVHAIRTSSFAFKRNATTIEADIRVHGYTGLEVEVELLEEKQLVRMVKLPIKPDTTHYTVSFEFSPERVGDQVYAVRVKPFPDEITLENNERHVVIRVSRDKIRVLQIAGHPSWDVRFLRNHLRQKPGIQLISFFILINTNSSIGIVDPSETALIPFPAEELFVNELASFDLIIFQDFNYGPFSTPQHLHRVRDYVKQGGAFLMLGGRLAMTAGGYQDTELSDILPVDLTPSRLGDSMLDTQSFQAALTRAGQTHAITQLAFRSEDNEAIWNSLPTLEGINKTNGLDNEGLALVIHPTVKTGAGEAMPVIAINEPGRGRSAVIASDSLWRWKLPMIGQGGDGEQYNKLLNNLVRWLVRDPEFELVRVTSSKSVRSLGERMELEVRVYTPDYRPAVNQSVSLRILRRLQPGTELSPTSEVVVEEVSDRTDENGRWSFDYDPTKPGIFDVQVRTLIGGRQMTATTVFVVNDERPEMRDTVGTDQLLSLIAKSTEGEYRSLKQGIAGLAFQPPRVSEVISRTVHERWNVPGIFFCACILFGLEWWVRRRLGLI